MVNLFLDTIFVCYFWEKIKKKNVISNIHGMLHTIKQNTDACIQKEFMEVKCLILRFCNCCIKKKKKI